MHAARLEYTFFRCSWVERDLQQITHKWRMTDTHPHTPTIPDYCRLQRAHVHLGELEEGIDVDVAVKHVHGGSR